MAFVTPEFNITVRLRHAVAGGGYGPWIESPAQLKGVPSPKSGFPAGNFTSFTQSYVLKLPARTDVRDSQTLSACDQVEVPGWAGAYPVVFFVYDVAFGFPNEYRCALLLRFAGPPGVATRLPGQGSTP